MTNVMGHRPVVKRAMVWLLCLPLLLLLLTGTAASYRTLETGMLGEDVRALKLRMYELGYYVSDQVSDDYNNLMASRVEKFQTMNGLEPTGVATPELQTFIFSNACFTASGIALAEPTAAPTLAPGETPSPYRMLADGDTGRDVLALKQRMYWLGYFTSYNNLSESYNRVMVERVKQFQQRNGLEATGIATPALQALIYSDSAIPTDNAPTPSPSPSPTPVPLPIIGPLTSPQLPALTEEGFLSDAMAEPFVLADAQDGLYLYLSQDLAVEIKRYTDPNLTLVWYETEIRLQNGEKLTSYLTPKSGRAYRFSTPEALAEQNRVVIAFTDDFFGHRVYNKQTVGIVVRNGEIISDKTYNKRDGWPPLDTMAAFSDGSMKTFAKNAYTAQEYLDMGAEQVFAFGPILVQDGQIGQRILDTTYYHYREPRTALGMIAPGHYLVLTVNGRSDASKGAYLSWLAERMLACGVTEALNLDGGGTTSLMFMGQQVNVGGTGNASIRKVTSITGVGIYAENAE